MRAGARRAPSPSRAQARPAGKATPAVSLLKGMFLGVSHSDSKQKSRPYSFGLSAAVKILSSLTSRNALHFGAIPCRVFRFRTKNYSNFNPALQSDNHAGHGPRSRYARILFGL
jgi:hypothetical protein